MKRASDERLPFSGIDGWGLSFANFRVTEVATDPDDPSAWQKERVAER